MRGAARRAARVRIITVASAWALAAFAAAAARADGSGDHKAAAQALFERAQVLVEQNHFVEACPQFAESQRLDPGIGTLLWLADCYENTGQTASAWTTFEQAATMAAARHDAREGIARERARKLETRFARLTIVVSAALTETPGLEIHCDGMPLDAAQWANGVSLDPGAHTITASATGRQLWWNTVQLAPASNATVTVPELALVPVAPIGLAATPAATTPPGESAASEGDARHEGDRLRSLHHSAGLVVGTAGVVGLLVGSVLSLNAKARYDDSGAFCGANNECATLGKADRGDASGMAAVATVAILAGAAAVGVGAALYLTAPRAPAVALAFAPESRGGGLRMNWVW